MLEDVIDDQIIGSLMLLNPVRTSVRTVADAIKVAARDGIVRGLHEPHVGLVGAQRPYIADPAVVGIDKADSDGFVNARGVIKRQVLDSISGHLSASPPRSRRSSIRRRLAI